MAKHVKRLSLKDAQTPTSHNEEPEPTWFAGKESGKCGSMVIKVEREDMNRRRESQRDIEGKEKK